MPIKLSSIRVSPLTLFLSAILLILLGIIAVQSFEKTSFFQTLTDTPPSNYVKGGIIVTVKAVNRTEANAVIQKYTTNYYEEVTNTGGTYATDSGNNYLFGVNVPSGQEKIWIEKLQKDPAVINARYQLPTD